MNAAGGTCNLESGDPKEDRTSAPLTGAEAGDYTADPVPAQRPPSRRMGIGRRSRPSGGSRAPHARDEPGDSPLVVGIGFAEFSTQPAFFVKSPHVEVRRQRGV